VTAAVDEAREAHRLAGQSDALANQHRDMRNRIVRQLRAEDPQRWTYAALAAAIGISQESIAAIIQGRLGRREGKQQ
jgi:hypothetical protein